LSFPLSKEIIIIIKTLVPNSAAYMAIL